MSNIYVTEASNLFCSSHRVCPPAAAVPLGLLGVEYVLQVAREEFRENLVRVEGAGPTILLVQDLRQSLAARPVRDGRPCR